jgi:hypothetical protein
MTIKNFYSVRPDEVESGDVFVAVVAVHVTKRYGGKLVYRAYRCLYPNFETDEDGVPQGARIYSGEDVVVESLMPLLKWANVELDDF